MKMYPNRRTILVTALIAATTVVQAQPRHPNESVVRAKVISSVPIYQTINEPSTDCRTETVVYDTPRQRHEASGGAVLGAIAGGLIGSAVGKGNGRVAAAAVGAATGAVLGDRADDRDAGRPRQIERCHNRDHYRQVINGYDVRYLYQGQEYSTRLPYDPGRTLHLRVSVEVADDPRHGGWSPRTVAHDGRDEYDGHDEHDDGRDDR